jgi:CRP-like cAMP-binding protein
VRCHAQGRCLLESFSPHGRATLALHLREIALDDGAPLFQQDEPAHRLHIVKSGSILVCHRGADQHSWPLGLFGPGMALGKLAPYVEHAHVFSAVSVGQSRICSISTQPLRTQPHMQRELTQALSASYLQFQREMATWSIIARVSSLPDQLGQALQQLARNQRSHQVQLPPHKILAALLGTTRESVARTLAHMRARKDLEKADRQQVRLGPRLQVPELVGE